MSQEQARRAYVSPARAQIAAETRARATASALDILRVHGGETRFTLEAVAGAAGITRQTLYRAFGSRRGLLEAVLENISARGGIARLDALENPADPHAALNELVHVYCEFWNSDQALFNLYTAPLNDPLFADVLKAHIAVGQRVIRSIVDKARPDAASASCKDMADTIFGLMQPPLYEVLRQGRTSAQVEVLLLPLAHAVIAKRR